MKSNCVSPARHRRSLLFFLPLFAFGLVTGPSSSLWAGVIFSDDFSAPTLNPAWQVLPGVGSYSLGPNGLRYNLAGFGSSPSGWHSTSLSLAVPFSGTSWQVDVLATHHLSWLLSGNYTGPSVPTQANSSGGQRMRPMVSFDPATSGDRTALGGTNFAYFDRAIDAWYGENSLTAGYGATSAPGLLNPIDSGITNNIANGVYWYRFVRDGGTLTLSYSSDGVNFSQAFTTLLANPASTYNQLVLSGSTFLSAGSYADIRSVTITDTIPEPGTWLLMSSGMAILAAHRRRNRPRH